MFDLALLAVTAVLWLPLLPASPDYQYLELQLESLRNACEAHNGWAFRHGYVGIGSARPLFHVPGIIPLRHCHITNERMLMSACLQSRPCVVHCMT